MVSANAVFPAVPTGELTSPFSVPLATLIPGSSPKLSVPVYPVLECPTPSSLPLSAYVPGASPLLVIPVYSPSESPSGFAKPVAMLTGGGGLPTLGPLTASFTAGATSGSLITTITGLSSGETISSVSPNDGRVGISSGSALVVGLAASSAGTISYTLTTSLGRALTIAVTASAAVTGPALLLAAAGQSLAQSLGTATTANGGPNASQVLPAGYSSPNARVKIWTGSAFETYQPYVNSEQGTNAGTTWGPEWGAASAWLNDNPTGTVYIVKHAVGSTGLAVGSSPNVWAPSAGQLYTALINKIAAAKPVLAAQSITITESALLWSQGQQDAKTTTDGGNYQANGAAFFSQFRTDTGIQRILLVRLQIEQINSGFPGWATVYAAQNALSSADQNIEIISTDGLETFDGLHRTVPAINAEAIRIGAVLTRYYRKAPYAASSNVIDIRGDRYSRATTAGDLTTTKACIASDVLACAYTGSATARTYINSAGLRKNDLPQNTLRFDLTGGLRGLYEEAQATNRCLYSRDLTQTSAWTPTGINALKDQVGRDGVANSASSITATAANATHLQTYAAAAGAWTFSFDVRRLTGAGDLQVTFDGTTWVTVTGVGAGWSRPEFTTTLASASNIVFGWRTVTSGDSFAIDAGQLENTAFATSPIYVAGSAVTRAAERVTPVVNTDAIGTVGHFVIRMRKASSPAGQFVGGDANVGLLYRQTLANRLYTNNGAGQSIFVDGAAGAFNAPFGAAISFDATGRRICLNGGTVVSDANPAVTRTGGAAPNGPTFGISSNAGTSGATQAGGLMDFIMWGTPTLNDNTMQAVTVAS